MQTKTTSAFTTAYNQLNPAQKQAVDTIDNPVMVMAGPGTGKTQVLTTRIANILLKTDTNPSSILALTYTDSATKTMRERLAKLIGKPAYYVNISTFHAFCTEVIRSYPEYFTIDRDSEPLSELERYDLLQQLIDQTQLEVIKPVNAPYLYLRDVVERISDLKRESISPQQFAQILQQEQQELIQVKDELTKAKLRKQERNLTKQQELLKLYQLYQQQLKQRQRYDFDDMIMLVVEAFQTHELLLREYQEQFLYFLVDEYQDTNLAQNKVVDLLASYWGDQANVFVVGDPNQAIFRFQGASIENMLGFVDRYPTAQVIYLNKGYRCPAKIYDTAHQVILNNHLSQTKILQELEAGKTKTASKNKTSQLLQTKQKLLGLLNQPLVSAKKQALKNKTNQVQLFTAPVQTLETVFVARQVEQLINKGVNPDEIAVLYLNNSDSVEMAQALTKWGIRYEINGGEDILRSEFINQLFNFFKVLVALRDSKEDELVYQIMHYPWFKLDALSVMKLGRVAGKLKLSLLELLDQGYQLIEKKQLTAVVSASEFEQMKIFSEQLYSYSNLDFSVTFTQWFEQVLKESGVFDWVRAHSNQVELLNQLNSLYNQVKNLVADNHQFKLVDFLQTIQVMEEHKLRILMEDLNIKQGAVQLSTVHKAKGQEWQYVFIIHCVDGKWGNRRIKNQLPLPEKISQNSNISKEEANEDERRSFYVALTRASQAVTISYPETIVQNNRTDEKVSSLFLTELSEPKQVFDTDLLVKKDEFLQRLLEPVTEKVPTKDEQQFFTELVKDFHLSVTSLNSYLRDPAEFVENNLLRLPRAKPLPMAFGTAVHQALERFYRVVLEDGARPSLQFLLQEFEKALQKEVMTESDFATRLRYGRKILSNYFEQTQDQLPPVVELERSVGYGIHRAILDRDIYLTGKIDRIDWLDQSKKLVRVIDYKTGKPRTEGYIKGLTKEVGLSEREQALPESIRGPYKRQLIFYKLLTQLDQTFNAKVEEGVFEFIEPYKTDDNRLMPRAFKITQEEVDDLKKLIREVMQEIRGLEFLKQIPY